MENELERIQLLISELHQELDEHKQKMTGSVEPLESLVSKVTDTEKCHSYLQCVTHIEGIRSVLYLILVAILISLSVIYIYIYEKLTTRTYTSIATFQSLASAPVYITMEYAMKEVYVSYFLLG